MNGLSLRISGGGSKIKNPLGFEPVSIPQNIIKQIDTSELHEDFFNSSSVDNQLSVLKTIVNNNAWDEHTIKFLVIVFLQAEAKHPVKSFLSRCVTRNKNIEDTFSKILTLEIEAMINSKSIDYKSYIIVVSKIATCVENFPAGSMAVKYVEILLTAYLRDCLCCCVETLRSNNLSPTEKNELFNLAHLTLRLLLCVVQKVDTNKDTITAMFQAIRCSVQDMLFDVDAPMDTKSVSGILLVTMHVLENHVDSWTDILSESVTNLQEMLTNDAAKLSLYSAIATVVPVHKLYTMSVGNEIAVIVLLDNILAIGERMSADSIFTLSVTRSLVQISKSLDKAQDLGLKVIDRLIVFVWSHLEHYMDSVRHLTAQMLNNIVKYSAILKKQGDDTAVNNIFTALNTLDRHRKSFYLTLTSLTNELGACYVMEVFPDLVNNVICVLDVQAVQASATTFLEVLLHAHMRESPHATYEVWVCPALRHVAAHALDSSVIHIVENLLTLAVRDEAVMGYVLPHIKQSAQNTHDLKCALLLLSVVRKSRGLKLPDTKEMWKGVLPYHVLDNAAVDVTDETRILSLSLIVESPKTTEIYTEKELDFVSHFLKYNCNAQAPHFRQLMLSLVKKFIKRLEDSYKLLKRTANFDYYPRFVEKLREQCFENLLRGVNQCRRSVALQTLSWIENVALDGYRRIWKEYYVDRLLAHLEDSYENNKMLALDILNKCPNDMFQKQYSISLKMDDILREASSVKPTDCTNAAYKLLLLSTKCPEYVLSLDMCDKDQPERVSYILTCHLLAQLQTELQTCTLSIMRAARDAPMYGLVHCMRYLVDRLDAGLISSDSEWTQLIQQIIGVCLSVNSAVSSVVNNSSPEGHLPMDMGGVVIDQGTANAYLQDGRPVTAQMVLLCAWRSVKEVSLLLGTITSRLAIEKEDVYCTLSVKSVRDIGAHFTSLLAETKHRGAFEQAYVGFTKLLTRLWRCRCPELHELPKLWLEELLQVIQAGDNDKLCATRRSAGLPYMIQALVITELQVTGNPKCFSYCMTTILHLATHSAAVEIRTHCSNILRALYRNTSLNDAVAPYVGDGLVLALNGFEGNTWTERNASTLLLGALCVRIFGVARSRADVSARNRMTGRIFFLRYPQMADFMLNKLSEANLSGELVRPSVYPVLLLLARLYPSALEGTVSNLKLVTFIPSVVSAAGSAVLKTRQLAARAVVPLISPHMYLPHIESMLQILCDRHIKRNYCHGIILQLIKLLEAKPENLHTDEHTQSSLSRLVLGTKWISEQTLTNVPCYLITGDYVKMIDLFICRFPSLINSEFQDEIKPLLNDILFKKPSSILNSGREVCLSNIVILYLRILNIHNNTQETCMFVQKCLTHIAYEVVLVILNYLLAIYEEFDVEYERIPILANSLESLRKDNYIELLCNILSSKYLECTQVALKLLVLEDNTQNKIINAKLNKNTEDDTIIMESLIQLLEVEHENLTHIYLKSLTNFLTKKLSGNSLNGETILEAIRVIFGCAFSHNNEEIRGVVVQFLEKSFDRLLYLNVDLKESDLFEYKATIWAMIVILIEDNEQTYRQRISNIITNLYTLEDKDENCDKFGETEYKFDKSFDTEHKSDKSVNTDYKTDNCTSLDTGHPTEHKTLGTDDRRETSFGNNSGIQVIPSKAVEYLIKLISNFDNGVDILCVLALLDFKSEVCMNDEVNDECRVFDQNERYNIYSEETILSAACACAYKQYYDKSNIHVYIDTIINKSVYKSTFETLCDQNLFAYKQLINTKENNTLINPKIKLFVELVNSA